MSGEVESVPLRPLLRRHGLTAYPVFALGLLGIVDTFQGSAFTVLTPELSRSLGMGLGTIAQARTLAFFSTMLAPLPMAALSQRRGRRAMLCILTAFIWSVITIFTGFVTSLIALLAVLVFDGLSTGSVAALHSPLLVDSYPPQGRVRILSTYQAIVTAGAVLSPLFGALLTGPLNLNWRGTFLALGLTSSAASLFAIGLRDPGPGKFDTEALRAKEHEVLTGEKKDNGLSADDVDLRFFEIVRRLLLIPTIKRVAVGFFCVGVLVIPFGTFLSFFLDQRWGLTPSGRGVFFAGISLVNIVVLGLFSSRAEKVFRADPGRLMAITGWLLAGSVTAICLGALAPVFGVMFALFAIGTSLTTALGPSLGAAFLSIVDARYRPHAGAVVGIFTGGGSLLGVFFLTGVNTRLGIAGSMVSLLVPGLIGSFIIGSGRKLINKDLDRMIDEVLESEDIRVIKESGGHLPMLSCKGINFSYGQLQVLFDVDFTVDDGEMVALLGTNGAGKSTLLKVMSGVGLPSTGTIRFQGENITYLDAERRVPIGITQVPGGRAVFGTLDVVENLRTFAYTFRRDRKRVDEAIELCLAAFPRLGERRASLASTLSGGEQQMLGLSKALILQPKVLLVDELSLGLAPVIVGQLLEMVRRINEGGTAVVLVEQSVNIALSLVDHAYFMEKGEMKFDGSARELLLREDLLRAVFLEGTAAQKGAVIPAP